MLLKLQLRNAIHSAKLAALCSGLLLASGCAGIPISKPNQVAQNRGAFETAAIADSSAESSQRCAPQQHAVQFASGQAPVEGAVSGTTVAAANPIAMQPAGTLDSTYCIQECNVPHMDAGCAPCMPMQPRRYNVQEYVFDGGDQQPQVVIRNDWSPAGVDPTDTVVYYETETGQVCVQPTNRVPIYAPRFGAVRQVRGALLAAKAVGTQRIVDPIKAGRFDDTDLASSVVLPVATHGEEQVNLIDAFQENKAGTPLAGVLPAQRMSEAFVPHEGIDVLGPGKITDEEIAVLGRFLQNARTWFVPESVEVLIEGKQAALAEKAVKPQDVHVYEIKDKCALRICKTASHTLANPGDVINFTIRFDNAGSKAIGNVVILDSLSPRLEYIEGSQQSSVDAQFTAEPNEVGSQVLRWDIRTPIKMSEGGVISFDCRVR